jgi:cytochrome c oxidase cbb3-type subunit 1
MATLPNPGIADKGFLSTNPELAAIDASVRWPVLLCFLTAVHWMVVGTFLLVYASSLTHPQDAIPGLSLLVDLSAACSFFTYGRIWPAALDAMVYGWASTAGIGLAIWLLARTSRAVVRAPGLLITGILFWNLGVAMGLTGIFLGGGNSVELLEFPDYASWVLWLAYALIAVSAVATYLVRKPGSDHIAQAWLLVALFAFPWLYATGSILLGSGLEAPSSVVHPHVAASWAFPLPGSGVMQGLLAAWYVHGIFTLWLAPLALALLYYLIPKMSGLNIEYASKAPIAFWTWIIFAPWTAVHDLVGGPFPADTVTVGLIFSGLIFIPVALIGLNLVGTAADGEKKQGHHGGVVFPFLTLAAVVFVAAGISEQILSIRSANQVLRFTMFRECNTFLWVYGFFSFTAFGAMYYIVPRLLDFGWRSALLIRIHYYASVYGILLLLAMLGFGGVMQGFTLENTDPRVTIITADEVAVSFYIGTTLCLSLISIGNGIFALHLGWMILDWLRQQVRRSRLASEILFEPYEEEVPAKEPKEVSV